MAFGLAVVRPEDRSPVVHALRHRGNSEALIMQVWHLSRPLEHGLDREFPGCVLRQQRETPALTFAKHFSHVLDGSNLDNRERLL
jgi:hypothetical protein